MADLENNLIEDVVPAKFIDQPIEKRGSNETISSPSEHLSRCFEINVQYTEEIHRFRIVSVCLSNRKSAIVFRSYDDFVSLHQHLVEVTEPHVVIPPLPDMFDYNERKISSEQLKIIKKLKISYNNVIEFGKYLSSIGSHPVLCLNDRFDHFLMDESFFPPTSITNKLKTYSILKLVSNKWKTNHRDCDDFYECERNFTSEYDLKMQAVVNDFQTFLISNGKLSNVLGHLSTCVTSALIVNVSQPETVNFMKAFTSNLDLYKIYLDVNETVTHRSLGVILQYFYAYNSSYKLMLSNRTDLMIKYENSNKNYQRNLGSSKAEMAYEEKEQIGEEFKNFSDKARFEIKRYHSNRSLGMVNSINDYARSQLEMLRHTVTLLKSSISDLKSNL
ncbi:hypothetical protein RDWZM_004789 [Blomia tropicalis]|uniref:PX domain-containing protein n=1 Tax=Blomia tropicalis TaxID=40697 RepID=A0A9Q0M4R8_BLOTA|nr:hypothetical protein RDWZM_004789 [Blomia tropicalis]